ncbi:DUF898 family protein [Pelagibacterium montanilacus]|uniref:DUF898 family protein n=1 Tax=Pelagibacterium montanilacus TaxID=2185280 RepID=UPI000F8C78D2|nr:DUF898 family protein [Pelagibacterium montanilacus]
MGELVPGPWGSPPPADVPIEARTGEVSFLGRRLALLGILLRGYVLTLATFGIYRFWLVTQRRRFYWSNTMVDDQPLEYTGSSVQLLVGFLLAVVVFIPVYGTVFYVSTAAPEYAALAYLAMFGGFFFLSGYAAFRGRRFRLTRTLWRGIRFGQSGSAWIYALKRFFWIPVVIITLGLAYPAMVTSLYRYRFSNTWFGDRRMVFAGKAGALAKVFYGLYAINLVLACIVLYQSVANPWSTTADGTPVPSMTGGTWLAVSLLVLCLSVPLYISRERSAMLSSISLGEARLAVRMPARWLVAQYLCYGLFAIVLTTVLFLVLGLVVTVAEQGAFAGALQAISTFGRGIGAVLAIVLGYLTVVTLYATLWEIVIGLGYWKLLAEGARIENVDAIETVRAHGAESPNIGEGLADALNVGSY